MQPRHPRPWKSVLLLCAALGLAACDPLKSESNAGPPVEEEPPPPKLHVTVATKGPALCREGTWTLSVSVEGGTPEKVELITIGLAPTTLDSPYRHTVDCATADEGSYFFIARATAKGRTFESPSASLVVDRKGPTIASWRPASSFPSVDTPVEIVFTESLLPESLQAAPTLLRDGNGFSVAHQAVLSEDGRVLRLVPSAPLRPPATLHVELVQRNMTDRAGNPLIVEPVLYFYERRVDYWPFARVGEAPLSEMSIGHLDLALEDSPRSRPIIAFVEYAPQPSIKPEIVVQRMNGDAWERLPAPRAMDARSQPPADTRLEVYGQYLVLAWTEPDPDTRYDVIHVSRYDGTSWTHLGAPLEPQADFFSFQMVLGTSENPVIVYEERFLGLRVVRWTGSAWEFLGDLLSGNPGSWSMWRYPALAADDSRVAVAWSETPPDSDRPHVFVMQFDNGSWSRVGKPLRGLADGGAGRVAIALRGFSDGPIVAWTEQASNYPDGFVYSSYWKTTITSADWTPPEQLQGTTKFYAMDRLQLVVDSAQEPWVVWQRGEADYSSACYYRRHRATGWEPEQLIFGRAFHGFRLDDKSVPWVALGYWPEAILRPQ
ncbi:Ig-like domain-containing protein [Pyxidicoccus caerfyrddinensis]|uniref:Ig-like domain-containing protein n=1 Tax=Pyxidicoccus caerfyrddinensis TaxID=2709663 RepID=UPI0013D9036D|nr:Ig-like domain-containing protein [Pyxidicoccus caerfyrddinensis]